MAASSFQTACIADVNGTTTVIIRVPKVPFTDEERDSIKAKQTGEVAAAIDAGYKVTIVSYANTDFNKYFAAAEGAGV